jgi:hypothetical protein
LLNGSLFTRDFLTQGVCGTDAWAALDDVAASELHTRLSALLAPFGNTKNPTEAEHWPNRTRLMPTAS